MFYNAQGSGGGLYRMHRMLPFAASTTIAVNEFVANYRQVKDGLPPIPSTDFATVSNNPVGNFLAVPPEYRPSHALQFNFGIQEQFAGDIVVKAAYVGNLGATSMPTTTTISRCLGRVRFRPAGRCS